LRNENTDTEAGHADDDDERSRPARLTQEHVGEMKIAIRAERDSGGDGPG
jgi:hypothetical protein